MRRTSTAASSLAVASFCSAASRSQRCSRSAAVSVAPASTNPLTRLLALAFLFASSASSAALFLSAAAVCSALMRACSILILSTSAARSCSFFLSRSAVSSTRFHVFASFFLATSSFFLASSSCFSCFFLASSSRRFCSSASFCSISSFCAAICSGVGPVCPLTHCFDCLFVFDIVLLRVACRPCVFAGRSHGDGLADDAIL
mmetsp:Transcript_16734/g.42859  ORF Transcript_16734/g.42859 Transcript_16734/m.42859 type:complete len:202 (-) Transcript_16734:62-667(-)